MYFIDLFQMLHRFYMKIQQLNISSSFICRWIVLIYCIYN